jgi:hypothetical protein
MIDLRAEANVIVLALGGSVHPGPRDSVVWTFLEVAGKKVLPQRLAHPFEEIPEVPDDWEVARDGMVSLSEIMNRDDCDQQKHESENEQYRHERFQIVLGGSVRRGPRVEDCFFTMNKPL